MSSYTIAPVIDPSHELYTHYSPLLAQVLFNRGFHSIKGAEAFLHPVYANNHDPFLMLNMEASIARVYEAIKNDERITIYADYDADGIPGAVILSSLFEKIGYHNYSVYLPHRHDEGYGIHIEALQKIKSENSKLIISIDVGITEHEAANWCKDNNMDLIITDHHLPATDDNGNEFLPDALYLINPKQQLCNYPDPMLCGCGVIFKFIQAFVIRYGKEFNIPEGWEKWLLDMVGIATLSDMVPLQNENRIFASYGMKVIKKTRRLGLKKLLWDTKISINHMNEEDIAFGITPKINAASRMSHPEDAYQLFMAKDNASATRAVKHLISLNDERKKLVAQTMKKAYQKLDGQDINGVIVVGSPAWQAGILGLVASKLVEKYQVPAFVWSEENGEIKGSCRTYNGLHLVDIMDAAEPKTFIQFGGHAGAGGFSCHKNEVHFLKERLEKALEKHQSNLPEASEPEIQVDAVITIDDVNMNTYQEIKKLAPFGMNNEKPLFLIKNIIPQKVQQFGKTKEHLEIHFTNGNGHTVRAITFFNTAEGYPCPPNVRVPMNLLAHIEHSVFMGKHELRLRIVDCVEAR